jgi:hypothetical protein
VEVGTTDNTANRPGESEGLIGKSVTSGEEASNEQLRDPIRIPGFGWISDAVHAALLTEIL